MGSCVAMQLLSIITKCRLSIEHRRTLSSPFLLAHRRVADDLLAEHMLELLAVAPVLRIRFFIQKIAAVTSGGTCSM
jgi:hypothetical protein